MPNKRISDLTLKSSLIAPGDMIPVYDSASTLDRKIPIQNIERRIELPPVILRSDLRLRQTISGGDLSALPAGVQNRVIGINPIGPDEVPNNFIFEPGVIGTDDNLNTIVATDLGGTWYAEIPTIVTGEYIGTEIEAASATRGGIVTTGAQTLGAGTKTVEAIKATNNGIPLELGTATETSSPAVTIKSNNTGFAAPSNIGLSSNGDKWVFWNATGVYKGAIGFNSREMWFQSTDLGVAENQFRWFGGSSGVPIELLAMGDVKGLVFNDTGLSINARFEGLADQYLLYLQGSSNQVCIGTNTPNGSNKLTINGGLSSSSVTTDILTEKTLGNGVVIPTGIFSKYETHPTFTSGSTQLIDVKGAEELVAGAIPTPIVNTIYVNKSFTGTVKNGTATHPYITIMDAVNSIPDAISGDNDGLKNIYQIFVFAGQYDEAVVVPTLKTPHLIEFIAIGGLVYLGLSTGSYFNTPVTPRNFEWRLTKPTTFATPVRPSLSLLSVTPESSISTHLSYAKSGWRISGNLLIGDISPDSNVSSTEFHLENVVVDGNFGLTSDSGNMGGTNIILFGCRFVGNFDFAYSGTPSATVNLNMVKDCNFNGLTFRVATIANLINCNLDNGLTFNAVNTFFQPSPVIVNTKIAGTLTAATSQNFYIDTISSQLSGAISTSNVTLITSSNLNISAPTLQSTIVTGTAPLTIASTTVNVNLNADMLDGKHSSDFPTLVWDGSIAFSVFYTVNNIASLTNGLVIELKGTGHTIDNKGSIYIGMGSLWFDSKSSLKTINIAQDATLDNIPSLINNVTLQSQSTSFVCTNATSPIYLTYNSTIKCDTTILNSKFATYTNGGLRLIILEDYCQLDGLDHETFNLAGDPTYTVLQIRVANQSYIEPTCFYTSSAGVINYIYDPSCDVPIAADFTHCSGSFYNSSAWFDHNKLFNLQQAASGITNGHINDQAQTVYGLKTFNNSLTITSGLKDADVTTAIKLGDSLNTSFSTINKTIVGALNEVFGMIGDENLWDRTGTNLTTHTAGDTVQVGNLKFNLNTISSEDTNGNIILTPNGTGVTSITGNLCIGTTTPAAFSPITISGTPNVKLSIATTATSGGATAMTFRGLGNTNAPYMEWQYCPQDTMAASYMQLNFSSSGGGGSTVNIIKAMGNGALSAVSLALAAGYVATDASGNLTAATFPSIPTQYWQRTSTTLSPLTSGDSLAIGNLKLDTSTISSTNTNGNVYFSMNGTGLLDISSTRAASIVNRFVTSFHGDLYMDGGDITYNKLKIMGGNEFGYLYGNYTLLGDGVHFGYNYSPAWNGSAWVHERGTDAAGTSRISAGYGTIDLCTGAAGANPTAAISIDYSHNITLYGPTNVANLLLNSNVISATNTNGGIVLAPNGSGLVEIRYKDLNLTYSDWATSIINLIIGSSRFIRPASSDDMVYHSGYDNVGGSHVFKTGPSATPVTLLTLSSTSAAFGEKITTGNLSLDTNTISSTNSNGDIILTPNGTGVLKTDNLGFYSNTISSTDSNGNINFSPNGTGKIYANNPFLSKINIISKTSDYTVQGNESGSILNTTGASGSVTFTLPTPGTIVGHWYKFHKVNGTNISIFDGTYTYSSTDGGAAIVFYYDGTSWQMIIWSGTWSVT